jgi:D-serine dehydratase
VRRVLMANQLVGRRNMAIVSELMAANPAFEAYVLVDSADGVEQLGRFFSERGQRIAVLLELGAEGGRTGVRDEQAEASVLAALETWKNGVVLAGIEVYEGVLPEEAAIRALLRRAVATVERLSEEGRFESGRSVLLSGAGSAWFDGVAEELVQANIMQRLEIVLRPGCYVTHDIGAYTDAQNRMLRESETVRRLGEGLLPAMHVWAYVQSRPEPGLAIIGLGKRDAAFDAGLPKPALHYRPAANVAGGAAATAPAKAPSSWTVTKMMDQHAYLSVPADADVRVGDMIAFDIYHPCLTWDKWRQVLVVNASYDVVDVLQTYF